MRSSGARQYVALSAPLATPTIPDKKAKRVLDMRKVGLSYRLIGRNLGLSKNTVMDIVRRDTADLGG